MTFNTNSTVIHFIKEEFEDSTVEIRIRKSKRDSQHTMAKRKMTKGQTTIYKTLRIELKTSNTNFT